MKKALIFDLDGTLWNSAQTVTESWNIVFERYPEVNRRITVSDMYGFMGRRLEEIGKMIMPALPDELRSKIMDECMDFELEYLENHEVSFYPALRETLEDLRADFSLIIVSNCQDGYIQSFLKRSDLAELFDDFESAGATGLSKGENIKLVIKRNNIEKAAYVGDTEGDMNSAEFAGIPFIHAAYGFGKPPRKAAVINAFAELKTAAREVLS